MATRKKITVDRSSEARNQILMQRSEHTELAASSVQRSSLAAIQKMFEAAHDALNEEDALPTNLM